MADEYAAAPQWVKSIGVVAWCFIGVVVALGIVVSALSVVSSVILPLVFAAVLAVIFRPVELHMEQLGWKASLAAGAVVVGLLALLIGVVVITVRGITDQAESIGDSITAALDRVSVEPETAEQIRSGIESLDPAVGFGFLSGLFASLGAVLHVGVSVVLGAMIMYYLLKDGGRLRRAFVSNLGAGPDGDLDVFVGDSVRVLRAYGRARTVMSAAVAAVVGVAALLLGLPLVLAMTVVNFVGGYIPYLGAFIGGAFAVVVALGDEGVPAAVIMLVVLLAANLLLENLVEPKVMGHQLQIHPIVVLVVTAIGGIVGGIVGLVLAVPFTVIITGGFEQLRSRGYVERATETAGRTLRTRFDQPATETVAEDP